MNTILHITQRKEWEAVQNIGLYQSDSLATEGFIHCSTIEQVVGSANRFFTGKQDLIVLSIDADLVKAKIVYEGADPNNLFPHIYGELNTDAVTKITNLSTDTNGLFILPGDLID
jgi:uncharacterized protein (DUF952 family)